MGSSDQSVKVVALFVVAFVVMLLLQMVLFIGWVHGIVNVQKKLKHS